MIELLAGLLPQMECDETINAEMWTIGLSKNLNIADDLFLGRRPNKKVVQIINFHTESGPIVYY